MHMHAYILMPGKALTSRSPMLRGGQCLHARHERLIAQEDLLAQSFLPKGRLGAVRIGNQGGILLRCALAIPRAYDRSPKQVAVQTIQIQPRRRRGHAHVRAVAGPRSLLRGADHAGGTGLRSTYLHSASK